MKKYITLLIALASFSLLAQSDAKSPFYTLGVSYSPSVCHDGISEFKGVKSTYSPLLEVTAGWTDFKAYAKVGDRLELGFRAGNSFLLAGMGYILDYNAPKDQAHNVFIEFGYHVELKRDVFLFLSSRHGISIKENLYFFSPLNISLNFKIK